jgi:hypothetical protein
MRVSKLLPLACLAGLLLATAVWAAARDDVMIRARLDDERNKVFELVNTGDRLVAVKVELTKRCQGQTNNRKPEVREHWVNANSRVRLGRQRAETTCPREYRILAADYP